MRRIKLALFHLPHSLYRWLKRLVLAFLLLLLIVASAWQFWFMPRLNDYRPWLMTQLEQAMGVPVFIGQVSGGWQGGYPQLMVRDFAVGKNRQAPDLRFATLSATLSIRTLFLGRIQFHQIVLQSPLLDISRSMDGRWWMGGVALSQQSSEHRDASMLNWLLAQNEIVIEQGQVRFSDAQGQYPSLTVSQVDFSTDQFLGAHRFNLALTPPPSVGPRIQVQGRLKGRDVAQLQQWSGWLKLQLPESNLIKFMPWLNALMPKTLLLEHGVGQLNLRVDLAQGQLQAIEADLGARDWQMRDQATATLYQLPRLDAVVFWSDTPKGKTLKINGRQIASPSGVLCTSCNLTYSQTKTESTTEAALQLKQWQLAGLNAYLPLLKPYLARARMPQLSSAPAEVGGLIQEAELSWQGPLSAAKAFAGRFDAQALVLRHADLNLGPVDLTGQWQEQGGRLDVRGRNTEFNYPAQFVDPMLLNELSTRIEWQKKAQNWRFDLLNFSMMNPAIQLKLDGHYEGPSSGLGKVKVSGDITHLSANQAYRYLPRILGDDVLDWLKQALLAGDASQGRITWQGDVAGFPYHKGSADEARGQFAIYAKAADVTLNYVPGWPMIDHINGDLAFEGLAMKINASAGEISKTRLSGVQVEIPNLEQDQHILVSGQVNGRTHDFLSFVANSPVKESTQGFLDTLEAEGDGTLDLKLDMPMINIENTKVSGRYRFKQNQLRFGGAIPVLNAATGEVEFSESAIKVPYAQAKALGGTVKLLGSNDVNGALVLNLTGDAAMGQIATAYLPALQAQISGQSQYQAQLKVAPKQFDLSVSSDLQGAKVNLPAPLGKNAAQSRALNVKASGGALQHQLTFSLGQLLFGKMQSKQSSPSAEPKVQMVLGLGSEVRALPESGVLVTGHWPALDVENWLDFVEKMPRPSSGSANAASNSLPAITVKELGFKQVNAWGRLFNGVTISAKPAAQNWQVDLESKELAGRINWQAGSRQLNAKLSKLWLPLSMESQAAPTHVMGLTGPVQNNALDEPSAWPQMNLDVADLRYEQIELGRLNVLAVPQGAALNIEQLQLKNTDGDLTLNGIWRQKDGKNLTQGQVQLTSANLGRLLTRFGYPEAMTMAPLHFGGNVEWQGPPWSPKLNSMQGQFKIDVGAGQFLKIDPGAGRFLTVLNLQAIPRRLKLDFEDLISQGFGFDRITGDATMNQGVAKTKNLTIDAPSAKVRFKGDANFVAGTQDIVVRIVPAVGDAVALGVAAINPIAGLATFAAQRLFDQNPLGELVSFEYQISGSMRDPQVKKLN
ncbi:TIGR02099 family protein [Deefgea piscis]|uniref:TIGR02099 family protein n=1 Tax=Deefgea piscis TaxID=2739061 RepID=A0A6M8SUR9_9NEIS|nr:YhdP family protein [Deefgea piscis]QKJ67818.1 TIGR02099 family protein [Deefgea piscis]